MPPTASIETLHFDDIQPDVPDLDALGRTAEDVRVALQRAESVEDCLTVIRRWEEVRGQVATYDALVDLRFNQDTADPERKAAREAWDAASPRWTELEIAIKRALLEHPLRGELEGNTGPQAFALWESEVLAFDPTIKDDLAKENALTSEYTQLQASAELEFQGEEYNLSTIRKFTQSADREVRYAADQVLWGWYVKNGVTYDRIYSDLVGLRTEMARKLGYANYVDMGYKRMCRVDYDAADVDRFRAAVVSEVVPLAAELSKRQAEKLGVDKLMAWDEYVQDREGNPRPKGDLDWMVARAREMFDEMGSGLGSFFRLMTDGGFLDLASRKGKAGGGFCTSFPTHGVPFVFANFNGTKGDVEVLTHEIGHAFQNFSSREQWLTDYHWPTYESAEIHSMSLEFLTWPWMDAFFGEDGERFRRVHLTESLLFLPYGTAVDHFQHLVYQNPEASPEERHGMWQEMERTYLPWRDWGDLEYPGKGGRWQHQSHIYGAPFYYIDYVLAMTCAMQFLALAETDREAALETYVALCGRGGSAPFQELVRNAGLTSPFDEGCLANVVAHARASLDS